MVDIQKILRQIPQVDEVLRSETLAELCKRIPRNIVSDSVKAATAKIRSRILNSDNNEFEALSDISGYLKKKIVNEACDVASDKYQQSLKRVINATGVVLHTNLGRSLLCESAVKAITEIAPCYSNLEFDLKHNCRGSRHDHIESVVTGITGAESAMVVNNNAAATMLVLSALCKDKEVVASRGELIEIGGSFRIPEIMELSGAVLKEVGTTNKTKLSDYEKAIDSEKTGALIKIHTSNYRVVGFTQDVELKEMVDLAHKNNLVALYDMGSGLFADLHRQGIDEPTVSEVLKTGVDVVFFSGDKLLAGPQAGIIVGKKKYIDLMKQNQLARVVRVDKLTIAALNASLSEYYDIDRARRNLPVLRMLSAMEDELKAKADFLAVLIKKATNFFDIDVVKCENMVGGGSAPTVILNGYAVCISSEKHDAEKIERILRKHTVPIVCRIVKNCVYLDVRTILDADNVEIVAAVTNAGTVLSGKESI